MNIEDELRIAHAKGLNAPPSWDSRALARIDALAARLAEAERLLDSGVIRLIQRDEFGQVGFHLIKGIDLRQCIAEAIESERPAVSATGVPE